MSDANAEMLQYAAAVPGPLRFSVRAPDGAVEQLELNSPFAVVGRSPEAHVTLSHQTVSFRHLYFQAIGSRLACMDLLSLAGAKQGGESFSGWVDSSTELEVCGYQIRLLDDFWVADGDLKKPQDFRPRDEHRDEYGVLPKVELELLNTSAKGQTWPINRVVTLVGRDERCRITVVDDRISRVQCALLLLPSGLWAIDLLGKGGTSVNGETCGCAMLSEGSVVKIGPYELSTHYPDLQQVVQTPVQEEVGGEEVFLTRQNRILKAEAVNDTLVVIPVGDSQSYFYQDIHIETSRISELITSRKFHHIVVDFSQVETMGHLLIEALAAICRLPHGKAALCNANVAVYDAVQDSPLGKVWEHYGSRQDAITAVYLP